MVGPVRPRLAIAAAALVLDLAAARAELPGQPDPTFNGGQPLLVDAARTAPRLTSLFGASVDAQGGLLVTGSGIDENGHTAVLVARISADGALDGAFGVGGTIVVQLGLAGATQTPSSFGLGIAPRAGGGWLVVGTASTFNGSPDRSGLATAFNANGTVDVGFGTGGSARPHAGTPMQEFYPAGGAVGPDGSAYTTGSFRIDGSTVHFALTKTTPAGLPDLQFGNTASAGVYAGDLAQGSQRVSGGVEAVVTPAGILVCGATSSAIGVGETLVARITPTGTLDPLFAGGTGFFHAAVGDPLLPQNPASQGLALAVGPDGELYAGGRAFDINTFFGFAITRLTPAGVLDVTYATGGTRRLQVAPANGGFSVVRTMVVQPDGKLVVVGDAEGMSGEMPHVVVLRLDVDGDLDPTFGDNGLVRLQYGTRTSATRAYASSATSSVVVLGNVYQGDDRFGFATRLLLQERATTTTTLPGGGCAPAPSLDGARCRVAALGSAIAGAVPAGKLADGLGSLVTRAGDRLDAAGGTSGKALRRKIKRARTPLRALGRRLASKAAERAIGDELRADLTAQTQALVSELQALAAAS